MLEIDLKWSLGRYKQSVGLAVCVWDDLRYGFVPYFAEQALMGRILLQMFKADRMWVPLETTGYREFDKFVFRQPLAALQERNYIESQILDNTTFVTVTPQAFFDMTKLAFELRTPVWDQSKKKKELLGLLVNSVPQPA